MQKQKNQQRKTPTNKVQVTHILAYANISFKISRVFRTANTCRPRPKYTKSKVYNLERGLTKKNGKQKI